MIIKIIKALTWRFIFFINLISAYLVYPMSFLFLRNKKIWVFMDGYRNEEREVLANNSKYFFLYVNNNLKSVKAIWIGRDKKIAAVLKNRGYCAHSVKSPKGIYYSLRAKYTFIGNFMSIASWRYSGGSKVIQLWHGKGPKKTGYDSPYSLQRHNKLTRPNLFCPLYRTIASSKYTAKIMASVFRIPLEKVLITGLPRDDVFFRHINGADIDVHPGLKNKLQDIKQKNVNKIILYAPTFRPDGSNPINQLNLDELNLFLSKKNNHFIILLHPKFATKKYNSNKKFSHISFTDPGHDIYPLFSNFDILITDYSSIYVDFLLLDRPILFYIYDLEKYKLDMGLYDNFISFTPGPHPTNFKDLLTCLEEIEENDKWKQNRQWVKKQLFAIIDGNASQRIAQYIISQKD